MSMSEFSRLMEVIEQFIDFIVSEELYRSHPVLANVLVILTFIVYWSVYIAFGVIAVSIIGFGVFELLMWIFS